jgi:DNA-binding response OmpR family regulator
MAARQLRLVLLIEDEPAVGDILRMSLDGNGYSTTLVATASQGRHHLAARRFDLVVADWRLPDGDGLDILNQAADAGIRTMLISGFLFQIGEPDHRHEYLMKPMRPSEFASAVDRLFSNQQL